MNTHSFVEESLPEVRLVALEKNHSVDVFDGVEVRVVQHCQVIAGRVMSEQRLLLAFTQMTEIPDVLNRK